MGEIKRKFFTVEGKKNTTCRRNDSFQKSTLSAKTGRENLNKESLFTQPPYKILLITKKIMPTLL